MSSRNQSLIACLLLAALACLYFLPVLSRGSEAVLGHAAQDVLNLFPLRVIAQESLLAGELPHWTSRINTGHALHAEGEAAIFYPINLALLPFPASLGVNLGALLHLVAGTLFFFLYLRENGRSHFAAFLGALFYMCSTLPVSRFFAGHLTNHSIVLLLPLLLWLWACWKRRGAPWALVAAAPAYGALILAGAPQYLYYISLYLAWTLAFSATQEATRRDWHALQGTLGFGAALAGGIFIGAIQLFPTLGFAEYGFRREPSLAFVSSFSLAPEALLSFVAPHFFGDMLAGTYWGRSYQLEMWGYLGVVPFLLALAAVFGRRDTLFWFHAAGAGLFLVLALGRHTPLFYLLYEYLPGFDMFRGSSKFLHFTVFSLCVLAAGVIDPLLSGPAPALRRALILLSALLCAFVLLALAALGFSADTESSAWHRLVTWVVLQGERMGDGFTPSTRGDFSMAWEMASSSLTRAGLLAMLMLVAALAWPRILRMPLGARLLLIVLTVPELWLFSQRYMVTTPLDALRIEPRLASQLPSGAEGPRVFAADREGMVYIYNGIPTVGLYTTLAPARYNAFLSALYGLPPEEQAHFRFEGFYPELAKLQVGLYALPRYGPAPPNFDLKEEAGITALYGARTPTPRAWLAREIVTAESFEHACMLLRERKVDLSRADLVETASASLEDMAGAGAVEVLEATPHRIRIHVEAPARRLLVLGDAWSPEWKASVEGGPDLEVLPVNIGFRGVAVPAGSHVVVFEHHSRSFRFGAAVTAFALALCLFAFIRSVRA